MMESFDEMALRIRREAEKQINIWESDRDEKVNAEFACRLAAELLRDAGPVGYVGRHVGDALLAGESCTTTITKHVAFTDDYALYLHPAPKVPEGWQLVPKEPTEAMIDAGNKHEHRFSDVIYRTMLAAAPKGEE